jgi:FlaA1/EpsC-like NDP-sugar epimerase
MRLSCGEAVSAALIDDGSLNKWIALGTIWRYFPLRFARKVAVAVIGASVLAFGIALSVLPARAFVVIPLGLAILATEFLWARRLLRRVRQGATSAYQRVRGD